MNDSFFNSVIENHGIGILSTAKPVGGGCINNTLKLTTNENSYFLKWNSLDQLDMFICESQGLSLLKNSSSLKIPNVIGHGTWKDRSFLLLEWIDSGLMDNHFWEKFGQGLARMHQKTSDTFGLDHNNYIGRLPQSNKQHSTWADFFVNERLLPQIRLAERNRLISNDLIKKFEVLFNKLGDLIPSEQPSFIHGDLWSGNFSSSSGNTPTIFDPAVHFGHRETEMAFTHLFGGFSPDFYRYYNEEYPLVDGFKDRIDLHNLNPLLVHVNLFGTSYLSGIVQTLKRYT